MESAYARCVGNLLILNWRRLFSKLCHRACKAMNQPQRSGDVRRGCGMQGSSLQLK